MSVSLVQDQSDPKLRRVFFCNLQLICEFKTMCLRIRGIVYSRHLSLCCRSGSEIFSTDPDLNLAYFPHTSSLLPHNFKNIFVDVFRMNIRIRLTGLSSLLLLFPWYGRGVPGGVVSHSSDHPRCSPAASAQTYAHHHQHHHLLKWQISVEDPNSGNFVDPNPYPHSEYGSGYT